MKTALNILSVIMSVMVTFAGGVGLGYLAGKATAQTIAGDADKTDIIDAPTNNPDIYDLLDAIEQVESGGNSNAVGDNGEAIGSFQIHKIYVDDVNRLIKAEPIRYNWAGPRSLYTYEDRWDREKSRAMTYIYILHYSSIAEWSGAERPTIMERFEAMARIHNGGPNGYKKKSTKAYWQKVKAAMTTIHE